MLANAIVNPIAHYGCEVYGKDVKQVNRVQVKLNNTMRIVTKAKRRTRISNMLDELKWMKLEEMIKYNKIVLLNKIISTEASPYCMKLIFEGMKSYKHGYAIRERDLRIAWCPKSVRKGCNSFLFTATKLYNQVKIMGKCIKDTKLKAYIKDTIKTWR